MTGAAVGTGPGGGAGGGNITGAAVGIIGGAATGTTTVTAGSAACAEPSNTNSIHVAAAQTRANHDPIGYLFIARSLSRLNSRRRPTLGRRQRRIASLTLELWRIERIEPISSA
jgi:hypothetical protein